MNMKLNTLFIALGIFFFAQSSTGQAPPQPMSDSLTWYTDFSKAMTASVTENKPIFGFFTGSDWCGWCHKLQREVFAKEAFQTWAKSNVILMEIDFPRRKQLEPEMAQQNQGLQQAFKVEGYPTIWIFKANLDKATNNIQLEAYGSLGYPSGAEKGKEEVAFLVNAEAVMASGKK
jgi:thioredoxin-related protein